jgi:tetratricopeptide (TPR) repeat protein
MFSLLIFLILILNVTAYASDVQDYKRALDAYESGNDVMALIYFQTILDDPAYQQFYPNAVFYLTKIHEQRDDFVPFFSMAARFLKDYQYDLRTSEIFASLMQNLVKRRAYVVAVDYLKEYDYLPVEDALLETVGHGLLKQDAVLADYVFSLCPQGDTIKVLRAFLDDDYEGREKIFLTLEGPTRGIYLTENHLLMGDTLGAYLVFRDMAADGYSDYALYRYAKLALLFSRGDVEEYAAQLRKRPRFENKAKLLEASVHCANEVETTPEDEEELNLYQLICIQDTISKSPPQDISLDSAFSDVEDTLAMLREIRKDYAKNYLVDSLYCLLLIRDGDYDVAVRAISPYLAYCNTRAFARKTLGIQHFAAGDYRNAAKHIIISNYRTPSVNYMLAECCRLMGYDAGSLYEDVISQTADSVLYYKARHGFINDRYAAQDFKSVCAIAFDDLQGDTSMVRLYVESLARCGQRELADSLSQEYLAGVDFAIWNLYGEYLIEQEEYARVKAYYDSVANQFGDMLTDELQYNWALSSFLNNEMDIAAQRFATYVTSFPNGARLHDALFKIATLNYLQQEYDSAAYYYGLASKDEDLLLDALRNQLISYKKAGDWPGVIRTGLEILWSGVENEEADVNFDIGYAFLRIGKVKEAIEYFIGASQIASDPRYYYWLGEAYLSKGDFPRAFYSYRKVIDLHPEDEMWVPTAQYKTGIVLELMDEIDAARAIYQKIVRDKGASDPIGAEANFRLQQIEQ